MKSYTLVAILLHCTFSAFSQTPPTLVQDYCPGSCSAFSGPAVTANGKMYFYSGNFSSNDILLESDGVMVSPSLITPVFPVPGNVEVQSKLQSVGNFVLFSTVEKEIPAGGGPTLYREYVYVSNGVTPAVPLMRAGMRVRADLNLSTVWEGKILLALQPTGPSPSGSPLTWFFYSPTTGAFDSLETPTFFAGHMDTEPVILNGRLYWIAGGIPPVTGDDWSVCVHDISAGTTAYKEVFEEVGISYYALTTHGPNVYAAMRAGSISDPVRKRLLRIDSIANVTELYATVDQTKSPSGGIASYGPYVVFTGYSSTDGRQILRYDPALGSINLVADLDAGADSGAVWLDPRNNQFGLLFFAGTSRITGPELYAYDWGANKTTLVYDLPGIAGYYGGLITPFGGAAYTTAQTPATGWELYRLNVPLKIQRPELSHRDIQLKISPNPAKKNLHAILLHAGSASRTALITSSLGRTLLSHPFSGASTTISVETLPAGTYFLSILEDGRRTATATFVEQ